MARRSAAARSDGPTPRWASLRDAEAHSGIPVSTLRDWARKGLLPLYRIGPRQIQVDLNDLDRLRRRVPTAGDRK